MICTEKKRSISYFVHGVEAEVHVLGKKIGERFVSSLNLRGRLNQRSNDTLYQHTGKGRLRSFYHNTILYIYCLRLSFIRS